MNDADQFRSRIRRAVWTMRFAACGVLLLLALALVLAWMIAQVALDKLGLAR